MARLLAAACASVVAASQAHSAPANSLRELYGSLSQCLKAPAGLPGDEVTLVFSLKRDGSLLGKPRISYANLHGDAKKQAEFVGGVLAAFARCLPVSITGGLGGVIAGRPMSFRVMTRVREFISELRRFREDQEVR